jgi:predicted Zn-dependent protease
MTGMTRFATFWVQNGKIQGPVNVMRFDESLYRMLGENLLGLTDGSEMLLSSSTYDSRSTHSLRLPGALIDRFAFTL